MIYNMGCNNGRLVGHWKLIFEFKPFEGMYAVGNLSGAWIFHEDKMTYNRLWRQVLLYDLMLL